MTFDMLNKLMNFSFGKMSYFDFEALLYSNDSLEKIFGSPTYLKLISLDYRSVYMRMAARRLVSLFLRHIDENKWKENANSAIFELSEKIDYAFSKASRLGGVSFHQAIRLDDQCDQIEIDLASKIDTDTNWLEVPEALISSHGVLGFFDPIGFRYYLPAYMKWAILNIFRDHNNWVIEDIFTSLNGLHEFATKRYAVLSDEQSITVAIFLMLMIVCADQNNVLFTDDAYSALDSIWGKFMVVDSPRTVHHVQSQ